MDWNLFFMILGVAYAATWVFKIVDLIERRHRHEKA
nr:MAG TPA: membrane protein [Caudoviricetes sp.]